MGDEAIPVWFPMPSVDAILLGRAVERDPHEDALRLALSDALDECGCESAAAFQRFQVHMNRATREIVAALGIPARFLEDAPRG